MQITSIRFDFNFESRPGAGELLAFASLEFDGELVIRRLRIVGYPDGRVHIFMPSRLVSDKFEDIVYPSSRDLKGRLYTELLRHLSREFRGRGEDDRNAMVESALARALNSEPEIPQETAKR